MNTKKICIVCPYPEGVAPSQRLKYEQYLPYFRSNLWQVEIHSFQSLKLWNIVYKKGNLIHKILYTFLGYINRIKLLFRLRQFDVVYIHLWVTPFGFAFFEWLYCLVAKKVVFDIDDLVFIENTSAANYWLSKLKGKNKPIYLMKKAHHVITTTPFLVEFCKQYNANVTAIPPSLDGEIIFLNKKQKQNNRITIGWSGSHSTIKYLELVESSIQTIAKKYDIEFLVFGVEKYHLDGVHTICIPWSAEMENKVFNQIDIAIFPLYEDLWSKGKYGGKMIQYLAAGLPMIISDANEIISSVIQNEHNGMIVKNKNTDWELAFEKLITSSELREKLAINARAKFENLFSIEANKNTYLNILNAVLEI